ADFQGFFDPAFYTIGDCLGLSPYARCQGSKSFYQPVDDVFPDFFPINFVERLEIGVYNFGDCTHQSGDGFNQPLNQGQQNCDPSLNDFRQALNQRCDQSYDQVNGCLDQCGQIINNPVHKGEQQVNPCLKDLWQILQNHLNRRINDLHCGLYQRRQGVDDSLNQLN